MTIALAVGLLAHQAVSPPAADAKTWYSPARAACANRVAKMRCYHNRTRVLRHLERVHRDIRLQRSAQLKAMRIGRCGQPRHRPCGDSWLRPFRQAGYLPAPGRWLVGENLAWGFDSAWRAFAALMRSPAHRANILDPRFADIGIDRRLSRWGVLWVIHYGRRW
jgi:uncharacterized protein YkwD